MSKKGEGSRGGKVVGHYRSGRAKYSSRKRIAMGLAGAGLVGIGTKQAAKIISPILAQKAESKAVKLGKQAGRLFAKAGPYGYFNKRASDFAKAAKQYASSPASGAKMTAAKFQFRAVHAASRFEQASKLANKAGALSNKWYKLASLLKRIK